MAQDPQQIVSEIDTAIAIGQAVVSAAGDLVATVRKVWSTLNPGKTDAELDADMDVVFANDQVRAALAARDAGDAPHAS